MEAVLDELRNLGAVYLDRHFVYSSGKHGPGYICMDPMFTSPELMTQIGEGLTRPFLGAFDIIVAPAVGGVALGTYTVIAHRSRTGARVPFVWADKGPDGFFRFERLGFAEMLNGKRVLAVEDLVTTGDSVMKVCQAAEACGGTIVGVSAVCNRGGVTAETLGVPRLESLANVNFQAVDADGCELCRSSVPIVVDAPLGHGAEYAAEHPGYKGGYVELLAA